MDETIERLFSEAMDLNTQDRETYLRHRLRGSHSFVESNLQQVLDLIADGNKGEALLGGSVSALAASLEPSPGTAIGAFILREKIGQGGMGVVFLADRAEGNFEQRVAIKLVQGGSALTARFLRERQILARLVHPRIARLIDGGLTTDGQPYMVMEYCDGLPISEYCRKNSLNQRKKLELFRAVCEAVEYAHRNLVVHRDLKPANILVSSDGEIKLLDFGIAKLLQPSNPGEATASGKHLFTPDYASPEQILGEEITTATDVYSLGAVLYQLLTGRSPHQLKTYTPHEMTQVICFDPPPALKLGNELDDIVAMALRKEPERRYASVASFSEDIARFLGHHPVVARGDSATYRARKFFRRHAAATLAASAAVSFLAAGLGIAAWQARVAGHRFEQVRSLAHTVLFDFDDKIRNVAGSTPARDFLATTAVKYLDGLAKEATGDISLRQELAAGYEKVADVQGEPARPNLGQRQNALANYAKALNIWTSFEDLVAMSRLTLKRQQILGNKDMLDEGRRLAAKAWAKEPAREDALGVVLQAEHSTGLYFSNRSEFDTAITHYQQAADYARLWTAKWPGKLANLAVVSTSMRMGDSLLRKGEPQLALNAFNQARAGNDTLLRENASDVDEVRRSFKLHFLIGHALGNPEYFNLGRTKEAIHSYEQAMAISEKLLAADPKNALARGDLADANWALAVTIAPMDGPRARHLLELAVADSVAVSAKSPATLAFIHNAANSHYALAGVLRDLGKKDSALDSVREAIRLQRSIVQARPKQIGLRHNMMSSLTLFLQLQLDSRDLDAATATWVELLDIAKTVDRKAASFRSKATDIASAYAAAGRLHALQRSSESANWYLASLAILDQLEASGVSPAYLSPKRDKTKLEMNKLLAGLPRMIR